MTSSANAIGRRAAIIAAAGAFWLGVPGGAWASDHLDTPSVVADARADIGDIFVWMSPDGRRLNLVMAIVGHSFSPNLDYVFHVDSGAKFGRTTTTTAISCRFTGAEAQCQAGPTDTLNGDVSAPEGLASKSGKLRVFAGLRDDPFFNNVRGTREAYNFAAAALPKVAKDEAGCPAFDAATSAGILDLWSHTTGGPPQNLLAGWTPASLVISVDLGVVAKGGKQLAVWAETSDGQRRIDRMGRPLTGNALLATLEPADVSNALKERYNAATPATSDAFVPEIEKTLGLYDAFDGQCGNAFLADNTAGASRYLPLAILLADDRLWINGSSGDCTTPFAVELAVLGGRKDLKDQCGGRTPNHDAVDVHRSLLATGKLTGITDGVDRDDQTHSTTAFPFLAPPPVKPATYARLKDR